MNCYDFLPQITRKLPANYPQLTRSLTAAYPQLTRSLPANYSQITRNLPANYPQKTHGHYMGTTRYGQNHFNLKMLKFINCSEFSYFF